MIVEKRRLLICVLRVFRRNYLGIVSILSVTNSSCPHAPVTGGQCNCAFPLQDDELSQDCIRKPLCWCPSTKPCLLTSDVHDSFLIRLPCRCKLLLVLSILSESDSKVSSQSELSSLISPFPINWAISNQWHCWLCLSSYCAACGCVSSYWGLGRCSGYDCDVSLPRYPLQPSCVNYHPVKWAVGMDR